MKTINKLMMLICCLAIAFTVSCSKEQTNEINQDDNSQLISEFERNMIDKVGEEEATQLMQNLNNPSRFPITYEGQLCPGVAQSGAAVYRGYSDLNDADFWYFTANAGDVVTIQVDRVSCEMDPVFLLYEGSGDTTSLTLLTGADDNNGQACAPACFSYADPLVSGYALPSTGTYTIAVWDFIGGSCTSGPQAYSIVMSGNSCDADGDGCNDDVDPHPNSDTSPKVVIDGCNTNVNNVFVTQCSTMMDLIADCVAGASNHSDFVLCMAQLTHGWRQAGLINGRQHSRIMRCAGTSSLP